MVVGFLITFVLQDYLPPNDDSLMYLASQFIEDLCVIFFTIEYMMRFVCSPNKKRFLKKGMNLIDLLAIIPFYLNLLLNQLDDITILGKAGKTLRLIRILRIIRIFKLVRHFAGLQALIHTIFEASKELGLLLIMILLAELTFAVFIFYAERHTPKSSNSVFTHDESLTWSYVDCLWFCFMTLTTVGGHMSFPNSAFGQLIGGCCAIMGVIIITLPIPIVVSSFARCYRNQLWRTEVAQRRMSMIKKVEQQKLMEKSKRKLIKYTSNMMFISTFGPVGTSNKKNLAKKSESI